MYRFSSVEKWQNGLRSSLVGPLSHQVHAAEAVLMQPLTFLHIAVSDCQKSNACYAGAKGRASVESPGKGHPGHQEAGRSNSDRLAPHS